MSTTSTKPSRVIQLRLLEPGADLIEHFGPRTNTFHTRSARAAARLAADLNRDETLGAAGSRRPRASTQRRGV
jgi:hypothetical protein